MAETFIQLPIDSANLGKMVRANTRTVGLNSVYEHFFILQDYTNNNQASISAGGALKVDGSAVTQPVSGTFWQATQPVSGTITANVGTTGGLALDTSVNGLLGLILGQASTTSGQSGPLVQGAVTTSAPTYVTAKTSPLSLTLAGALRIDGSGVTQPVSGAFFQATQPVSIAAHVTVDQGAAGATAWKVDGSGVTQPVSGTFWQATQPVSGTVTSNVGTTNGLALDTSVNGLLLAQGSATSGEKGPLLQGAVTTAAPSYATTQTSPLSLTLAGALRVDGSTVTQPVSGTFFQATQPVIVAASVTVAQATAANLLGTMSQGGTWTVQPGNTANSTAWLVTGTGGTFPVTGTVTSNIGTTNGLHLDATFTGRLPAAATLADATANPTLSEIQVFNMGFNGTTWDRLQVDTSRSLKVSNQSLDATAAATALNALNASVSLAGQADVGFAAVVTAISSPTGIVLTPQVSCDGGTSWTATAFYEPQTGNIYQTLDNTRPKAFAAGQQYKILCGSGVSNVRVIATSWTSGSVTVALRSNDMEPLVQVMRNQTSGTYTAVYQLATATSVALSSSLSAAAKQYATIYHPATALKQVRIKRIVVNIESVSVATKLAVQLQYLTATTAPATGNPAITPTVHRPGAAVAEATCLALPTTPGSTSGTGVGLIYSQELNLGISTANTAANPTSTDIVLFDDSQGENIEPLIIRAATAEGWAIVLAASGTSSTVLATAKITFVEE